MSFGISAPPEPQQIQIPSPPVTPPPPPVPNAKIALASDCWYVVNSKVECSVRGYPAGIVSVSAKKGPRDISAKFVDGNGTTEDRSYDGPFLYVVRASGKGDCTLVITPLALKSDSDILTANLLVDSNTAPQPPPVNPVDPVVTDRTGMFVVIVEETAQAVAARGQLLADPTLAVYMKSKGHKWRVVDQDVVGADGKTPADVARFIKDSKGKPLPQMYLVDNKGYQIGQGVPCPTTAAGILEAIKKVGG